MRESGLGIAHDERRPLAGRPTPRKPIQSYRDIEAYQGAMALLAPLHEVLKLLPVEERWELASQMRRASKSIPANIAEGYGKKRSARDFRSYLDIALGSANETVVLLEIAVAVGYVSQDTVQPLIDGYEVVAKQLFRLSESWKDFNESARRQRH
jgi:four helix bundle protein